MFGSSFLEVAIGVILMYLLLSLVCSSVNEAIATVLQVRSTTLFNGIKNLLNDPNFTRLAQQVYNHGLVDAITKTKKDTLLAARRGLSNSEEMARRPSYMSSST